MESVKAALMALEGKDENQRREGAHHLGKTATPFALDHVWRQWGGLYPDIGEALILGYMERLITENDAIEALLSRFPMVQGAGARRLATLASPMAIAALLEALDSGAAGYTYPLIQALIEIGDVIIPSLIARIRPHSRLVTYLCINTLQGMHTHAALQSLRELLDDERCLYFDGRVEKRVCDLALRALQKVGTLEALQLLAQWEIGEWEDDN